MQNSLVCGITLAYGSLRQKQEWLPRLARGEAPLVFPVTTCHGALAHYITTGEADHFQPMNVNFGLLPPLPQRIRKKREKKQRLAERALADIETFRAELKE